MSNPHVTRDHAKALLLTGGDGKAPRSVLVLRSNGRLAAMTPDDAFDESYDGRSRILLTQANLADAGVRIHPDGRLADGAAAIIDRLVTAINADLAKDADA
ncbi:hypothetical protein ETD86_29625 [Nonomuraea turkmeniaca]|uniref:Uncharacterized protein n=1 Tax=Nonomuraea turkmeniaca TaxID=103838 RepID=A0A5S4FA46_9ACTN|nr:hypothetical protein [Nonomuraea turkmeniaca]TMR14108.1 hypothetical protein ETD86_29625 [Nonomuraea turkmeniaca]